MFLMKFNIATTHVILPPPQTCMSQQKTANMVAVIIEAVLPHRGFKLPILLVSIPQLED